MSSDRGMAGFSNVDDDLAVGGTALTFSRVDALERLVGSDINSRWDESDRAGDDHAALAGLAGDLSAELRGMIDRGDDRAVVGGTVEELEGLRVMHGAPTPWSGRLDEAAVWGRALDVLVNSGDAYDILAVRDLAASLSADVAVQGSEAHRFLMSIDAEERRLLVEQTYSDRWQETFRVADAALVVSAFYGGGAESWTAFKNAVGFDGMAAANGLDVYAEVRPWEPVHRAGRLQREFADMGIAVSVGRPDGGADYTVLTCAPLVDAAASSLVGVKAENEAFLDRWIEQGHRNGGSMLRGLVVEDDVAVSLSTCLRENGADDRASFERQLDGLEELLRSVGDPGEMLVLLGQMGEREAGLEHPALDLMVVLDGRRQMDLHTIAIEDQERGATYYNNRPPVYDRGLSQEENAAGVAAYIAPRLRLYIDEVGSGAAGKWHLGVDFSDADSAQRFGRLMMDPYRVSDNAVVRMMGDVLGGEVEGNFRMWAIAETDVETCASSLVGYMDRMETLADYDPQVGDGSATAFDLLDRMDWDPSDEDAFRERFAGVEGVVAMNRWLLARGDERALSEGGSLHLEAIAQGLLHLEGGDGRQADDLARLAAMLELPDWAVSGSDAAVRLAGDLEADREARFALVIDDVRRRQG